MVAAFDLIERTDEGNRMEKKNYIIMFVASELYESISRSRACHKFIAPTIGVFRQYCDERCHEPFLSALMKRSK